MSYKAGEVYVEGKITLQPLEAGLNTMAAMAQKSAKQFENSFTGAMANITAKSAAAVNAMMSNFSQLPTASQKTFTKLQVNAAQVFSDLNFYSKNFAKEGAKDATTFKDNYVKAFNRVKADARGLKTGGAMAAKGMATHQGETIQATNAWDNLFIEKYTMAYRAEHIGRAMFFTITWPLYNMTKQIATVVIETQSHMQRLQALTGATGAQMTKLQTQLMGMSKYTFTGVPEMSKVLIELSKAGYSMQQAQVMSGSVAIMAKANMMDLATSTEITINVMKAYGFEANAATAVTDLMAKAANSSAMDIRDLAASMKYVAPIAAALNVDIRETAASIAVLSDAGLKGSMSGTALRGMYFKLLKPTPEAKKIMDKYQINPFDDEGMQKSMADMVEMFEKSMISTTEIMQIFQQRAFVGFMTLLNAGSGKLREMEKEISESQGYNAKQLEIQMADMVGSVTQLKIAFQNLALSIGTGGLNKEIKNIAETLTRMAERFANASDATKNLVIQLVKFFALLPLGMWQIGVLVRLGGYLRDSWAMLKVMAAGVAKAMTTKATATTAATVALIANEKALAAYNKTAGASVAINSRGAVTSSGVAIGAGAGARVLSSVTGASAVSGAQGLSSALSSLGASMSSILPIILAIIAALAALYGAFKLLTAPRVQYEIGKFREKVATEFAQLAADVSNRMQDVVDALNERLGDTRQVLVTQARVLEVQANNVGVRMIAGMIAGILEMSPTLSTTLNSIGNMVSNWLNGIVAMINRARMWLMTTPEGEWTKEDIQNSDPGMRYLGVGAMMPGSSQSRYKYAVENARDPLGIKKKSPFDKAFSFDSARMAIYEGQWENIAQGLTEMNDTIFKNSHTLLENELMLLDRQKQEYLEAGHDKVKVAEWEASEKKRLYAEDAERQRKHNAGGVSDNKKALEQKQKDQEKYYEDLARAQGSINDRIFELQNDEFAVRKRNIDKQLAEYSAFGKDLVGVSEWYGLEIQEINKEMLEIKAQEFLKKFEDMMSKAVKLVNRAGEAIGNALKKIVETEIESIKRVFDELRNAEDILTEGNIARESNFSKQKITGIEKGQKLLEEQGPKDIQNLLFPEKDMFQIVEEFNIEEARLAEERVSINEKAAKDIIEIQSETEEKILKIQKDAAKEEERIIEKRQKTRERIYDKERSIHDMFMENKISGQDMQKIKNWMASNDLTGKSKEEIWQGLSSLGIDNRFFFDDEGNYNTSQVNSLIDSIFDIGDAKKEAMKDEKEYASFTAESQAETNKVVEEGAKELIRIQDWQNTELRRILTEREDLVKGFEQSTKKLVIEPYMMGENQKPLDYLEGEKTKEESWIEKYVQDQRDSSAIRKAMLDEEEAKRISKAEAPISDENINKTIAGIFKSKSPEELEAWLGEVTPGWKEVGISFSDYLLKGMVEGLADPTNKQSILDNITTLCQSMESRFDEYFQINSPSKVMYDKMGNIIQGMTDAVPTFGQGLLDALDTLLSKVMEKVSAIQSTLASLNSSSEAPSDISTASRTFIFNNVNLDEREVARQVQVTDMAMGYGFS